MLDERVEQQAPPSISFLTPRRSGLELFWRDTEAFPSQVTVMISSGMSGSPPRRTWLTAIAREAS